MTKKYTKEELIQKLIKLKNKSNKVPTNDMNKTKGYPSIHPYIDTFGSWNNALKTAQLDTNYDRYTKKELLEKLLQLKNNLGRIPSSEDLHKGYPSKGSYQRALGSWNNALKSLLAERYGYEYTEDQKIVLDFTKGAIQ